MQSKNWRNYQKEFKTKRTIRKAVCIGVAVLTALMLLSGILVIQWWRASISDSPNDSGEWPVLVKEQQINFLEVIKGSSDEALPQAQGKLIERLSVCNLSKQTSELSCLEMPADISLSTSAGEYAVSQLLAVGSALNPPQPLSFLKKTVEDYLAVPLDGVIIGTAPEIGVAPNLGATPKSGLIFWWRWLRKHGEWESQLQTNFTRGQLWGLVFAARKVREDKIQQISLGEQTGYEEIEIRDKLVQSLFIDSKVESESLTARVFNGTTTPGLASEAARFIENLGIKVLVVDNYERTDVAVTQIINYQVPVNSWGLQRLKQTFGIDSVPEVRDLEARAGVDVIIGED